MQFQPSVYSFETEEEYAGWFQNIWTREGRAENKLKRAERKRKKGKTKAAERLEGRAGVLKAKASGKGFGDLHPDSPYDALWGSKFPWTERKRMATTGLTGAARGYRPSRGQYRSEWRGTIIGALLALRAAGIDPYTDIVVESLPMKMKQGAHEDKKLIEVVESTTGKQLGSLQKAAEKLRKVVIKQGLEEVAWPARALPMLGASSKRAAITGASAGAAATGLQIASGTTASIGISPPWVQNVVTLPVALILQIAAGVSAGVGAGAAAKGAVAKSKAVKYEQEFVANLQEWATQAQTQEATKQVNAARAKLAYQQGVAQKVGEIKGQETVNAVKILAWAGGISFALIATSAVVGTMRNRA